MIKHTAIFCAVWVLTLGIASADTGDPIMPIPSGTQVYGYFAVSFPVVHKNPSRAKPVGLGKVAEARGLFGLQVTLPQIDAPADLYLGLYFPALVPGVYLVNAGGGLEALSGSLAAWGKNVTGPVNEFPFWDIPVFGLPVGTYYFVLIMTPAGQLKHFTMWITWFAIKEDPKMVTPYKRESDIEAICQTFSKDNTAPWGFQHGGIDVSPAGNLKPFQAVFDGVVVDIAKFFNEKNKFWQVNVAVQYDATRKVFYAFEPISGKESDADIQLDHIAVSVGQAVSEGDIIGSLLGVGEAFHVDFSFYEDGEPVCPEPYFKMDAKESILTLLHKVRPDAFMCY